MRASSNNHYEKSLPFTDIKIHSNKYSEDDTGYDSLSKQKRLNSISALSSSSSSSNNQFHRIMNLVKSLPSPTDVSNTSETALTVAERIAKFSQKIQSSTPKVSPIRKLNRTRIQPILDSTSDSADSFTLSNHVVFVSSYPQQNLSLIDLPPLEYIHDQRFDSTTTVDHIKNDVINIELQEQEKNLSKNFSQKIKSFGESIRSLPANVLAIVFISLIGGLIVSVIFIIIIL